MTPPKTNKALFLLLLIYQKLETLNRSNWSIFSQMNFVNYILQSFKDISEIT